MPANTFFHFKQFSIEQQNCAMKVSTDACLFGASIPLSDSRPILDIGTGTGLLALMVAQRSSGYIDAVELDAQAAQQAIENINSSPWQERITVYQQSIQRFAQNCPARYGTIICNPPFFTNHSPSQEPRRHQARHNDTLSFSDLGQAVTQLLTKKGLFHVLLPASEHQHFVATVEQEGLHLTNTLCVRPTQAKAVSRHILTLSTHLPKEPKKACTTQDICIHTLNGYSQTFIERLRPYYLKL